MDNQKTTTEKMVRMFALVYGPLAIIMLLVVFVLTLPKTETDNIVNIVPTPLRTSTTTTVTPLRAHATTTIIAFGDSITAGYGVTVSDAYPAQLERILRGAGYNASVSNAGVSGETTAGGLRRAEFVAKQKPDIVLIVLGGNDALRGISPTSTRENLAGIIKIFQDAHITVLLAGMQSPENMGDAYVSAYNEIFPSLAREYGIEFIPFLLEGVALDPTLNQSDGIHPNPNGAEIIARENILPHVVKMLDTLVK